MDQFKISPIEPPPEIIATIYHDTMAFVIPDVLSINLKTGEVELFVEVSEATKKFWEALQLLVGDQITGE